MAALIKSLKDFAKNIVHMFIRPFFWIFPLCFFEDELYGVQEKVGTLQTRRDSFPSLCLFMKTSRTTILWWIIEK